MTKTKTDVLVIGSGVGGLCAAARLAAKGVKVILAEKLPYLGGRLSSRNYKGYKLTTGAIMVPYGEKSAFQESFDLVGAPLKVRETLGGFRMRLDSGDFDATADGSNFPDMLEFALGAKDEVAKVAAYFLQGVAAAKHDDISFREWLGRCTDNEGIQNLFQGFCGAFVGLNSNEVTVEEFFFMMKNMVIHNHKYGVAVEGNEHIMNALAAGAKEKGVEVWTGASCKGIAVEGGRASGAVIERDGEEEMVEADYIVSNVGANLTVKLAGEPNFGEEYMASLNHMPYATPVVHVCFATKEPVSDFKGIMNFGNARRLVFLETPTLTCPELAPEGMHFANTFSVPENAAGPLKLKETIELVMLDLEDNFPSFKKNAEILFVATHHGEWPAMRRWPGYTLPTSTPIENLHNVGDACLPRGIVGVEACAETAKEVVERIAS